VTPGDAGFFVVPDAFAGGHIPVIASAPGYSSGYAYVGVLPGETTNVILHLHRLDAQSIDDPSVPQTLLLGKNMDEGKLKLAADALQTVYGTPARGAISVQSATLSVDEAPGGMRVELPGSRQRFARLGMIELRVAQVTAQLTLSGGAAKLTFAATAPRDPKKPTDIYRFDEQAGVFRPYRTSLYDEATHTFTLPIDAFGIYAAAEPLAEQSCANVRITDSHGAPVPSVALQYASEREGTQLLTDTAGQACLELQPSAAIHWRAFGRSDDGLFEVPLQDAMMSPADVLACDSAMCADFGESRGVNAKVACVRGKIAATTPSDVQVSVTTNPATGALRHLRTGEGFCLDLDRAKTLRFVADNFDCGQPIDISAAKAPRICAEGSCLNIGTVKCTPQ
jgi:hypothetical protein